MAASHTSHNFICYLSCIYVLLVVIIVCITFLNMLPLIFYFSIAITSITL